MPKDADPHTALSPVAQLLAQAFGVVAPHAVDAQRMRKILFQARTELTERQLTHQHLRRCTRELVDAGICQRARIGDINAAPAWALPLTRKAHAQRRIAPILAAFRATSPSRWADRFHREMLLRCAVVAGDTARVTRLAGEDEHCVDDWEFLAEPFADDLLATLPEQLIDGALIACARHVIDTAAPPEPVIAACGRLSSAPAIHAADIAFIRILQGRFQEAEAVFAALPPVARGVKPATTGLAATRALIATLRGDDLSARGHIDAAIAAEKSGTRKHYVFPDLPAFALSLLSLVRIDSPGSLALLERLRHAAERRAIHCGHLLSYVTEAEFVRRGHGNRVRTPIQPCLILLMDSLACCWHGAFGDGDGKAWLSRMLAYRNRAVAHCFGWLVAECDETLRRFAELNGDRDLLARIPDPQRLHLQFGTRTLAVLGEPVPDWEHPLKALERLSYDARNKQGRKRAAKAPAKKRLVWQLHHEYDIELSPREQRQNKNGTWSKGRKVSLKRLASDAAKMDFLLPQDRDVADTISIYQSWGHMDYYLGQRGLYALAGHPHVFNSAGEPVDIVRREPELSVSEGVGGRSVVTIEPHVAEAEGNYNVIAVSPRRYEVTRFSDIHQRLFEVIPLAGLELPAGAKPRLLEAVSGLASQVRVQSDAADSAATAVPVDADAEPWVRLEPVGLDSGLTAALVVEPIPDSDISFEPGKGGVTVFANRDGHQVQAQRDLEAERNAAARLIENCRPLASWPTESEPLTLSDPTQCLEFLEQLTTAGARCKWPKGEPFRIVAHRSASSLSLTVKSADQWMRASGKLAVDDQRVLDLKQLFALLESNPGSRFLELGNGEFLALTGAFRRQLDDLASLAAPEARGAMRLHPLAASALDELFAHAKLNADDGWRELCANIDAARSFEPELPSTLQAELRPYQLDGFRWLARLGRWGAGACLADDMGLGKTVQTLAVLLDRAPEGPALVVAPTSVVANWVDEARRFAPTLRVKLYTGAATSRIPLLENPSAFDLYITTYGVLQNDAERLVAVGWHSAVLDEAQAIKNPSAKRARTARRLAAQFRVITTGTPIQNNLMDLFSLFSFANPGLLGSSEQYRRNFGVPIERDGDLQARARLRRIIAPFILRRLKADVLDDLPERTEITLHVTMSPDEATIYEVLRQRAVEELEAARAEDPQIGEGARRVQILAHLTRLRLACCNPKLVLGAGAEAPKSSKLEAFATTLDELLENRHKVLVFSQFVMHLKLIETHLRGAGIAYQYLDGSTPAKARAKRIAEFQAGRGDVFLISLKAGGFGLNLTAADYVIHMDPWWNPAVEDQASDRAHRIGQTRPVTIYRMVAEGTIEEQIVDLHHRKRSLADQLLEGADAAGRLNADELLALLQQPVAPGALPK
ncbi:DEAD/DEAH box helicase [Candidatus Rariloculus sp.]|uniref:DEAD/DEAH box helicase n=1 Tax=Candidatus Rariloculus sp. TaxID=3101265 RepID=UPI003D0C1DFA